jgi:cell division GTPase FtsZ
VAEKDMNRSLDAARKTGKQKPAGGLANIAARLSPAAHRQAARQVVIEDEFASPVAFRLAFLGSGQGGCRIANSFWSLGYRSVGAFNTTEQDFDGLDPDMPKVSLNIGGARKDMQLARDNLKGRDQEVWDLFQRAWGAQVDYGIVCVGLGGGTGSGTALPLVQLARRYMEEQGKPPRVGALVSIPSADDGQQICRNAVASFRELLHAKVSPFIVIDNARVHELYKPPMADLLPKSNELVSEMLHLFNQLAATKSPHVTFDSSELADLLDSGIVVMGAADIPVADIKSPADVSSRIRGELAKSVLAQVDLGTGNKAACIFVGDDEVLNGFSKDYFTAGFTQLDRVVGTSAGGAPVVVHRGIYPSTQEGSGLQCYTMVSALAPPYKRLEELARRAQLGSPAVSSMAKYLGVE